MTERDDPLIPPLGTVAAAAEKLCLSIPSVHRQIVAGRLTGVPVGRLTLVFDDQVDAFARRARGRARWRLHLPTPTVPDLVSPTEAAEILGFSQGNWVRALFHRGDLPGRRIGPDIVLRRQVIKAYAATRDYTTQDVPPDQP